jgi:hypothetical protein
MTNATKQTLTQTAAGAAHHESLSAAPVWAAHERGELTRGELFARLDEIGRAMAAASEAVYEAAGR